MQLDTAICSGQPIVLHFNISGNHGPFDIAYLEGDTSIQYINNVPSSHEKMVFPSTYDSVNNKMYTITGLTDSFGCKALDTSFSGVVNAKVFGFPQTNAGENQEVCDSLTQLNATRSYGRGEWSKITGNGKAFFSDPDYHRSTVTIRPHNDEKYLFMWKETNWQCVNSDTIEIEFYDFPYVDAGDDFSLIFTTDTMLSANSLSDKETGSWSISSGEAAFQDVNDNNTYVYNLSDKEKNILKWTVKKGVCAAIADSVVITIDDLRIPTGFSPNNDNINDYFVIGGLEHAADNHLVIFNRWGNIIYEKKNYQNTWDGTNKEGKKVSEGTYFYVLKINGAMARKKSGYIIIKRNP